PSWDGAAPERQQRYSTGAAAGARAGQGSHVAATETRRCVDGPSVPPAQGMQVGKRAGKPGRGQTWKPSFVKSRLDSHLQPSQFTKKREGHVTLQFIVGTDHLASQPTISRFENRVTRTSLYRMALVLLEQFIASYTKPPKVIVLDVDDTEDRVH